MRRLSYKGPFADFVNHRALPGRDPSYAGESADVLLYPCDWVTSLSMCDGFNIGNLGVPTDNFAYLTVILCGFAHGAKNTLLLANAVLDNPHRAEVVLLVEPDVLQMLEEHIPATGFSR